jgi:hypothetical protein
MTASAQAQGAVPNDVALAGTASAAAIHFELPAQALASALKAYGHVAKLGVLIDTSLLDNRVSAPVNGDYPRDEALRRLLAGTGLTVNFTSANAAVIVPLPPSALPPVAASSPDMPVATIDGVNGHAAYAILVQARLTEALCASPLTRPGNYRLVVQLRIDDSGMVKAAKVLDSTGDPARDAAIARITRDLVLDSGPPADLEQPVTILLRPLGQGVVPDCPPSSDSFSPASSPAMQG